MQNFNDIRHEQIIKEQARTIHKCIDTLFNDLLNDQNNWYFEPILALLSQFGTLSDPEIVVCSFNLKMEEDANYILDLSLDPRYVDAISEYSILPTMAHIVRTWNELSVLVPRTVPDHIAVIENYKQYLLNYKHLRYVEPAIAFIDKVARDHRAYVNQYTLDDGSYEVHIITQYDTYTIWINEPLLSEVNNYINNYNVL